PLETGKKVLSDCIDKVVEVLR
ncbi:MAG: hypothetical protein ACD_75C01709G0001, partial [uncultured bacterium]